MSKISKNKLQFEFTSEQAQKIQRLHLPPSWLVWKPFLHLTFLMIFFIFTSFSSSFIRGFFQVLAASQLLSLYTLMHQASHGSLSKINRVNNGVGILLGTILGTTFSGYRASHLLHHKHLRTSADPQEVVYFGEGRKVFSAFKLLFASFFGAVVFIWVRVPTIGLKNCSKKQILIELATALLVHLFIFGGLILGGKLMVVIPSIIIAIVWGSMVDIVYHQGLSHNGDCSSLRSLYSYGFGFLVLNGENWHAEHHAFPKVPGTYLSILHEIIGPKLKEAGTKYEKGFFVAFMKGLFENPFFLPIEIPKIKFSK
ncbi:MAG: fatty acid desaturase [Nitrospira sp.]|nr:fatty acid desaturase [Nitrospira sp.]